MQFKISRAIVSTFQVPICWICRYSEQSRVHLLRKHESTDPADASSFCLFFVAIIRPSIALAEHPRRIFFSIAQID